MSWDPTTWKRSRKLLVGIATIWPVLYMILFMIVAMSLAFFFVSRDQQFNRNSESIDLIELQQKIKNGEVSRLTVTPYEIVAWARDCECQYHTNVSSRSTRAEIIRLAGELDENGKPRVPVIEENTSTRAVPALFPAGIAVLMILHFFTICLTLTLMVIFIVIAVQKEPFDQTTRIVWIILLCLMSVYVMPVFWYLYIWREPSTGAPTPDPA